MPGIQQKKLRFGHCEAQFPVNSEDFNITLSLVKVLPDFGVNQKT